MVDRTICVEVPMKAEFMDIDSMNIVWHGNYVKYMERARWALMDHIGYNYDEMVRTGFSWPIVSLQCKYIKPLRINQEFIVCTTLIEWENRIRITFLFKDTLSGQTLHKAESIQMAMNSKTGEGLLATPDCVRQAIHRYLTTRHQHA